MGGAQVATGTKAFTIPSDRSFTVPFEPDIVILAPQDRQADDWRLLVHKGGLDGFTTYPATTTAITGKYTALGSAFAAYLSISGTTVTLNSVNDFVNWNGLVCKWIAIKL